MDIILAPNLHQHLGWMCDLETLATENAAVIPEVSLVAFEMDTGNIVHEMTLHLSVDEQLQAGRKVSSGTLAFWLTQSEEAREKLLLSLDAYCADNMLPTPWALEGALTQIRDMVRLVTYQWELQNIEKIGRNPEDTGPRPLIYGNGARFDCGKLADLYEKAGREEDYPFGYAGDRDIRTLHSLVPAAKRSVEFEGIPHYGLDDCKHQIKYTSKIYAALMEASEAITLNC